MTGSGKIIRPSAPYGINAAVEAEIFLSDTIETARNATLTIQFDDDTVLTLSGETKLEVSRYVNDAAARRNSSGFKLTFGKVRGLLSSLFGGNSEMTVETDTSIAGVRGSDLSVWIEGEETIAAVLEGEGFMQHRDERFPGVMKIKVGEMLRSKRGMKLGRPGKMPDKIREKLKKLPVKKRKELIKKLKEKRDQKKLERLKKLKTNKSRKEKVRKDKRRKGKKGKWDEEEQRRGRR